MTGKTADGVEVGTGHPIYLIQRWSDSTAEFLRGVRRYRVKYRVVVAVGEAMAAVAYWDERLAVQGVDFVVLSQTYADEGLAKAEAARLETETGTPPLAVGWWGRLKSRLGLHGGEG